MRVRHGKEISFSARLKNRFRPAAVAGIFGTACTQDLREWYQMCDAAGRVWSLLVVRDERAKPGSVRPSELTEVGEVSGCDLPEVFPGNDRQRTFGCMRRDAT